MATPRKIAGVTSPAEPEKTKKVTGYWTNPAGPVLQLPRAVKSRFRQDDMAACALLLMCGYSRWSAGVQLPSEWKAAESCRMRLAKDLRRYMDPPRVLTAPSNRQASGSKSYAECKQLWKSKTESGLFLLSHEWNALIARTKIGKRWFISVTEKGLAEAHRFLDEGEFPYWRHTENGSTAGRPGAVPSQLSVDAAASYSERFREIHPPVPKAPEKKAAPTGIKKDLKRAAKPAAQAPAAKPEAAKPAYRSIRMAYPEIRKLLMGRFLEAGFKVLPREAHYADINAELQYRTPVVFWSYDDQKRLDTYGYMTVRVCRGAVGPLGGASGCVDELRRRVLELVPKMGLYASNVYVPSANGPEDFAVTLHQLPAED
jgi:hypothetical protein